MSMSKIVAMMALIVFAMGIFMVGDVVAGEKFKCRTVTYTTKYNQINVGDEDGHIVAVWEAKGIQNNREMKWFNDGWVDVIMGVSDFNLKTGVGILIYYGYVTDKDGDKYYYKGEVKNMISRWEIVKGTGKFEGIHGGGTATELYYPTETLFYANAEWDVELPRR